MKSTIAVLCVIMSLLIGCTSANSKAAELLETARFEEKQNNLEHATKLYNEIITAYPTSPAAGNVKIRLDELKTKKP